MAIKKGKREGTTLFAKSNNPFLTAGKFDFEKINKHKVNIKIKSDIIFLLNFNTNTFTFDMNASNILNFINIFIAKYYN